ncbi:MAG: hypothetical protein WC184_11310 [Acidimicrobiia bacterium]
MSINTFIHGVTAPGVLAVATQFGGEHPRFWESIARNPHTDLSVVKPVYEHFKSSKMSALLLEHTNDPDLAEFLLGRNEKRKSVIRAGLENWFLPERTYENLIKVFDPKEIVWRLQLPDGYTPEVKHRIALNLPPKSWEQWLALNDTGFTATQLLSWLQTVGDTQPQNVLAVEAVLARHPQLLNQLGNKFCVVVAQVVANFPVSDRLVDHILVAAVHDPAEYRVAVEGLLQQPWISVEAHHKTVEFYNRFYGEMYPDTVSAALSIDRGFQGHGLAWFSDPEVALNYLATINNNPVLYRRLLEDLASQPDLANNPKILGWVAHPEHLGMLSKNKPGWLSDPVRNLITTAINGRYQVLPDWQKTLLECRAGETPLDAGAFWKTWDFMARRPFPLDAVLPPQIGPGSNPDKPVLRPGRPMSGGHAVYILYGQSADMGLLAPFGKHRPPTKDGSAVRNYIDATKIVDWLVGHLGEGDTPESVANWERAFILIPAWEGTLVELVEALARLGVQHKAVA